jgi:hypothetical protein
MPDGSLNTWSHWGPFPGGVAVAIVEIEKAEEEVPERSEVIEEAVTPDEELVVPEEDADTVIDDMVVAEAESEALSLPLVVEMVWSFVDAELEIGEVTELEPDEDTELVDTPMLELPLMLMLVLPSLELVPSLEDEAAVEDDVDANPTELNLPGSRFKCVSLSSVTTSLPTTFLK